MVEEEREELGVIEEERVDLRLVGLGEVLYVIVFVTEGDIVEVTL